MHEPGAAQPQADLLEQDLGAPTRLGDRVEREAGRIDHAERVEQARGVAPPAAQLRAAGITGIDRDQRVHAGGILL
jgi:hypothetical protein